MKQIISKVGRLLALQAVTLVSFFAISSNVLAEMPAQPKSIWSEKEPLADVDGATIAKDARRDTNT